MSVEADADTYRAHLRRALDIAGVEGDVVLPAVGQTVGELRLHWLDWGGDDASAVPVLFLHGGGLTAHTWDVLALGLRRGRRCLALDQRGHGRSEWSASLDYGPAATARDVDALLDDLELEQVVLVGQSMGGLNALHYAATRPERVAALVAIDAAFDAADSGREAIRRFMTQDSELDSFDAFVVKAGRYRPGRDEAALRVSLGWNVMQLPNGRWTWRYDMRHRIRDDLWSAVLASRADLRTQVRAIGCPVMLVRGERSPVVPQEMFAELAAAVPQALCVVIAGAGHNVHGDRPAGLLEEIQLFLADLTASQRGES